ncbi:MAG: energy transducer TonB [Saprospiraceae bacterium]
MKYCIYILMLCFVSVTGYSQNYKFEFPGRINPVIKREKLNGAIVINDIMPAFSKNFGMPYQERNLLSQMLDQQNMFQLGFLLDHRRTVENYNKIIEYISIEISVSHDDNILTAQSTGELLTPEQKIILNTADLGSDISIKLKFRFRNAPEEKNAIGSKLIEGRYVVTLVPETEAEYPGGFNRIAEYLTESVINKIVEITTVEKIRQVIVNFTIDENGQIVDAKISRSSNDTNIDKLILEATLKMQKWTPAENAQGIKVKQEFNIPFGNSGC